MTMPMSRHELLHMSLELQPVLVDTGTKDEEGCLVFADGRLVAVLVRLSDQHDGVAGQWYHEHGFGPELEKPAHPIFPTLDAAQDWICERRSQSGKARRV